VQAHSHGARKSRTIATIWFVVIATEAYEIDRLQDVRCPQFLERRRMATLFHTKEWLDTVATSDRASVLTTSRPGERLTNCMVFLPGSELADRHPQDVVLRAGPASREEVWNILFR
jgi:hypothetical protein